MTAPRILVVDDEPNIRDLLVTSLRFAGYQVRAVSNGAQTISAVLEEEPDLIILDVMLPDMNGFSVTKRLRGAGYTAPILFLTAKDETEDKIEGLNAGGDDYVTKPYSSRELLARIEKRAEHLLHRADALAYADASAKQGLEIGSGAQVIGMHMRLDQPLHPPAGGADMRDGPPDAARLGASLQCGRPGGG